MEINKAWNSNFDATVKLWEAAADLTRSACELAAVMKRMEERLSLVEASVELLRLREKVESAPLRGAVAVDEDGRLLDAHGQLVNP